MRILHLLSQTELTGAEVYAQNLIQAQVQEGHEVHVISDRIHVPLPIPLKSLPVSTSKAFQRLKNIIEIRKFLKAQQIEVIHCHSRGAVRHAYWARLRLRIGMVTTLHGRQHFSWSKRLLNTYGDILLAVCENVKKAMELDFKMPGSSIRISRNPVQILKFGPVPGISRVGKHLALVGRSSGPKGKRFEEIGLSCFDQWLKEFSDLQISIIAPQPENFSPEFHAALENWNQKYPKRVQLLGHVPNLRMVLGKYDLIIGSGRIAIESLMDQIPVLALGEYCSHGLVRLDQLPSILASNFGDIGAQERELALDTTKIATEVRDFFRGKTFSESEKKQISDVIKEEFDDQNIQTQVMDAYQAALFKRWVPQWIPALMYHKIPDEALETRHRIFVQKSDFENHLRYFAKKGFQTLTFHELRDYWTGKRKLSDFPRKPLLLTFDDGYKDNLSNAEPLLKKYGFQATIFLLGNHNITENTWDANTGEAPYQLMTLNEKKQLDPQVWEIGSHGFVHLHLTEVSEPAAMKELKDSKTQLEKDLGREIHCFAYPFGSTNEHIQSLAQKAGYSFAVNTDQGGLHTADQPFGIFRVNIFPEDGNYELWKKTAPWYRKYFYRKRKK